MKWETNQGHTHTKKNQLNNNMEMQADILIIAQLNVIYLTMMIAHKRSGKYWKLN